MAEKGYAEIMDNYNGLFTAQTISLISGLKNVLGKDSLLAYLVSMTLRVVEIHRVLRSTGSFYFHCDPTASHYIKLMLDGIFCPKGGDFRNEIIWHYQAGTKSKSHFGEKHDVVFYYNKSNEYTFNVLRQASLAEYKYDKTDKDGRKYHINGQGNKYYFDEGRTFRMTKQYCRIAKYMDWKAKSSFKVANYTGLEANHIFYTPKDIICITKIFYPHNLN